MVSRTKTAVTEMMHSVNADTVTTHALARADRKSPRVCVVAIVATAIASAMPEFCPALHRLALGLSFDFYSIAMIGITLLEMAATVRSSWLARLAYEIFFRPEYCTHTAHDLLAAADCKSFWRRRRVQRPLQCAAFQGCSFCQAAL